MLVMFQAVLQVLHLNQLLEPQEGGNLIVFGLQMGILRQRALEASQVLSAGLVLLTGLSLCSTSPTC